MSVFLKSGQLSLPVRLDDSATLENYYVTSNSPNESVLQSLKTADAQSLYLWGSEGAGVTHLLQGLCHQADKLNQTSIYIPLSDVSEEFPALVLEGLENMDQVCLDELDSVVDSKDWSEQLFHLFNKAMSSRCRLAFGATMSPMHLNSPLADLQSRLSSLLVHRVDRLSDEEMNQALIFRARRRGMDMPESVAEYLVTRFSRKLSDQFSALDALDAASLIEKRKLTIPFVKSTLKGQY